MPERPPGWVDPLGVDQYEAMKEVRMEMHELKKIKDQKDSIARRLGKVRNQLTTSEGPSGINSDVLPHANHPGPGTRDTAYPSDVGAKTQEPQREEAILCTRGQRSPQGVRRCHQEDDASSRA
jgi:hypothetical protein